MVGFPNKPMGFPTKHDHFGVFWGYHHLRKHPCGVVVPTSIGAGREFLSHQQYDNLWKKFLPKVDIDCWCKKIVIYSGQNNTNPGSVCD